MDARRVVLAGVMVGVIGTVAAIVVTRPVRPVQELEIPEPTTLSELQPMASVGGDPDGAPLAVEGVVRHVDLIHLADESGYAGPHDSHYETALNDNVSNVRYHVDVTECLKGNCPSQLIWAVEVQAPRGADVGDLRDAEDHRVRLYLGPSSVYADYFVLYAGSDLGVLP